jgi:NIMA-interacting peptidyl-prolyl cis-trans isomerase 1
MAANYPALGPLSSDGEAAKPHGKIRCAHLLVKHNESRRASSWKQVRLNGYRTQVKEEREG